MLSALIAAVRGFFANGVGAAVGNGVANTVAWGTLLAPVAIWLLANKDETAVTYTFTYGQLLLFGLVGFFVLKVIHLSRPGSPRDREGL